MPSLWIDALKQFNMGQGAWCIPRKGTEDYKKVRAIMDGGVDAKAAKKVQKIEAKHDKMAAAEIKKASTPLSEKMPAKMKEAAAKSRAASAPRVAEGVLKQTQAAAAPKKAPAKRAAAPKKAPEPKKAAAPKKAAEPKKAATPKKKSLTRKEFCNFMGRIGHLFYRRFDTMEQWEVSQQRGVVVISDSKDILTIEMKPKVWKEIYDEDFVSEYEPIFGLEYKSAYWNSSFGVGEHLTVNKDGITIKIKKEKGKTLEDYVLGEGLERSIGGYFQSYLGESDSERVKKIFAGKDENFKLPAKRAAAPKK